MKPAAQRRIWLWFLVTISGIAIVYGLLPTSLWKEPLYDAAVLACVLGVLAGILWHRPARGHPWWFFLAGMGCICAAEWIWFINDLRGVSPFPSWGEYLDLAGRLLLLAGLGVLASKRGTVRDHTAVTDAIAVGVAACVVVWVTVFRDYFDRTGLRVVERFVTLSYLALDVAIVVALVLLLAGSRGGAPALRLLALGVVVLVTADIVWLVLEVDNAYTVGHLLDVSWPIAYACIAAAALHPTMRDISRTPSPARAPDLLRSLSFAGAVATLPVLDLTLDLAHVHLTTLDEVAIGAGATIIAVCVMVRFFGLIRLTGTLAEAKGARRTEALVRESRDVIAIAGADRKVKYVSPAIEHALGWPAQVTVGMPLETLALPEERALVVERFEDVLRAGEGSSRTHEMRVVRPNGPAALMEIVVVNHVADPDIAGVVLSARDITERRRLEDEIVYQAFHDALTGLANRRLLLDHVTLAINNRRVDGAPSAAVVLIDLDDFKSVNELLGHAAGDDLLLAVAERLTRCVRPGDTVARLGGDEFALLLLDADPTSLPDVAERLLGILSLPLRAGEVEIATSASVGIRKLRRNDTAQLAVRDADIAMYSAKTNGKHQYAIFDTEMGAQSERRLALKADLRGAWRRGEISVAFQPIVDLADGRLRGAEALMRWTHPLYGAVSPTEFVGLAEETGSIRALGLEVLREAAYQTARWRAASAPSFYISVNVSPVQLEDGFVDAVDDILATTGLEPHALVLEVTENVLVTDFDASVAILQTLRDRGIRIAIDDFGTGYSSLSYAQQLPVDLVKIDRSFTSDLGTVDRTMVPAVVNLARTLGASVVAEGVETEAQAGLLLGLDCELGQGHLYAPALPEATFRDLVRAGVVAMERPLDQAPIAPVRAVTERAS